MSLKHTGSSGEIQQKDSYAKLRHKLVGTLPEYHVLCLSSSRHIYFLFSGPILFCTPKNNNSVYFMLTTLPGTIQCAFYI